MTSGFHYFSWRAILVMAALLPSLVDGRKDAQLWAVDAYPEIVHNDLQDYALDDLRIWRLTLQAMRTPKELGLGFPMQLILAGSPKHGLRQLWMLDASDHLAPLVVQYRNRDSSKLNFHAQRVKGIVKIGVHRAGMIYADIDLQVQAAQEAVSGSFTAIFKRVKIGKGGVPEDAVVGPPLSVQGLVSGSHSGIDAVRQKHELAKGMDYERFGGPKGSGCAPDSQRRYVDSFAQVRLHWVSEENIACSWGEALHNWLGGYTPPCVWNNRIYVHYSRPAAGHRASKPAQAALNMPQLTYLTTREGLSGKELFRSWDVPFGDDVVACMDAATGLTLWKRVFPGGVNVMRVRKHGPFSSLVVKDGLVYAQGSMQQVYCLDALTGAEVWMQSRGEAKLGPKGKIHPKPITTILQEAGGVIYAPTWGGLDAKTGKQLWSSNLLGVTTRGHGNVGIRRWTYQGKEYFLCGAGCVEPRTGQVLWETPDRKNWHKCFCGFNGMDRLFLLPMNAGRGQSPHTPSVFAITPTGIDIDKPVWQLPRDYVKRSSTTELPVVVNGRLVTPITAADKDPKQKDGWRIVSFDAQTGGDVKVYSSREMTMPVAADGKIFACGGSVWDVADDGSLHKWDGQLPIHGGNSLKPVAIDGRVYARTQWGFVVCYDFRKQ